MEYLPNIFGRLSISGTAVADLFFFVMTLFAAVMSVILFFHWRKYGMGGKTLALAELLYLTVSVALLVVAFLAFK